MNKFFLYVMQNCDITIKWILPLFLQPWRVMFVAYPCDAPQQFTKLSPKSAGCKAKPCCLLAVPLYFTNGGEKCNPPLISVSLFKGSRLVGESIALIRLENAFLKVLKRWISRSSGPESQPSSCQASATESSLWSFARGLCTSLLHCVDAESSIIQGITLSR